MDPGTLSLTSCPHLSTSPQTSDLPKLSSQLVRSQGSQRQGSQRRRERERRGTGSQRSQRGGWGGGWWRLVGSGVGSSSSAPGAPRPLLRTPPRLSLPSRLGWLGSTPRLSPLGWARLAGACRSPPLLRLRLGGACGGACGGVARAGRAGRVLGYSGSSGTRGPRGPPGPPVLGGFGREAGSGARGAREDPPPPPRTVLGRSSSVGPPRPPLLLRGSSSEARRGPALLRPGGVGGSGLGRDYWGAFDCFSRREPPRLTPPRLTPPPTPPSPPSPPTPPSPPSPRRDTSTSLAADTSATSAPLDLWPPDRLLASRPPRLRRLRRSTSTFDVMTFDVMTTSLSEGHSHTTSRRLLRPPASRQAQLPAASSLASSLPAALPSQLATQRRPHLAAAPTPQ